MRVGVGNFFDNLKQLRTLLNEVLQGKLRRAGISATRFIVNSTVGLAGLLDPATPLGLPHHTETFAETLALWQVPGGPYLVIPLLGPSTTRDAFARLVDTLTNPINLIVNSPEAGAGLWAIDLVDGRYRLLPADKALEESLDSYLFLREAYLQRMTYEMWDGNPPLEDFEDEEDWGDDEWEVAD